MEKPSQKSQSKNNVKSNFIMIKTIFVEDQKKDIVDLDFHEV